MRLPATSAPCSWPVAPRNRPTPRFRAPRAESVPKPPVSPEPLDWQPGHWDWAGNGYLWSPGQYVLAAGHGLNWMPG
jgi:hypothetical protein